ncbi:MAG: hypothetical protein K5695_11735 [Oscillospiraceae bacterium]|nr:hypothetical protein [Oscillospiraceae bacterium]
MDNKPIETPEEQANDRLAAAKRILAKARAAHERDKQRLEQAMEEAHKAGKPPFDVKEFLSYYRYFGAFGPGTWDGDISEISEESLFSYKYQYYVEHPEMTSARELAIYLNKRESQWE